MADTHYLKGWISGIRISGDLAVNTYRDDTVNPAKNTLEATANGNTSVISWYDGATPDVDEFMKNFALPYYDDVEYTKGDIVTKGLSVYSCQNTNIGEFKDEDWLEVNVVDMIKLLCPKPAAPTYVAHQYEESPAHDYGLGDYVFYNDKLYKANAFVPAGPFDPTLWDEVVIGDELQDQAAAIKEEATAREEADDKLKETIAEEDKKIKETIANGYNPADAYSAGDFCIYKDKLYKAKESTTGTFDATKWELIQITDELGEGFDYSALMAPAWTPKTTDGRAVVRYNKKIYVSKKAIGEADKNKVPGSAPDVWVEATLADIYKVAALSNFNFNSTNTTKRQGRYSNRYAGVIGENPLELTIDKDSSGSGSLKTTIGDELEKIHGSVAPAFSEDIDVFKDGFVVYLGDLYKANKNHSGPWNSADFDKTDVVSNLNAGSLAASSIAPEWSPTHAQYIRGEVVMHDGKLYMPLNNSTPGIWKPGEWVPTSLFQYVTDQIKKLYNVLGLDASIADVNNDTDDYHWQNVWNFTLN